MPFSQDLESIRLIRLECFIFVKADPSSKSINNYDLNNLTIEDVSTQRSKPAEYIGNISLKETLENGSRL